MRRRMLLAKIHRATITHADLHYEGSCTIDSTLMEAAGMLPNEELQVWNITRGTRLTTYTQPGPHDSGVICINGAAAHGNEPGDLVILATFAEMSEEEARDFAPKVLLLDERNRISEVRAEVPGPHMPRRVDQARRGSSTA